MSGAATRQVPALSIAFAFCHLARGGFPGLASLGWWEGAVVLALLAGLGITTLRRVRRHAAGGVTHLRPDLELGGALIAAAYVLVAIGGKPLFPIVYLLMAFLVSFLPRTAGLILLGVALVFDGLALTDPATRNIPELAAHATFLILFAALYHLVLSGRMGMARRAESQAVRARIREVEEHARTFRLVASGSQDSSPGMKDQEKWLMASVKEIEGAVGAALEIAEAALETHTCAAFLLGSDERSLKLYDCRSSS
ncbi:MAG TPA: diguanylate cyclase, partial [Myxococcaceae bacterium]|nr:diguanylate cyclase [Myxococcaceae bacterium]